MVLGFKMVLDQVNELVERKVQIKNRVQNNTNHIQKHHEASTPLVYHPPVGSSKRRGLVQRPSKGPQHVSPLLPELP